MICDRRVFSVDAQVRICSALILRYILQNDCTPVARYACQSTQPLVRAPTDRSNAREHGIMCFCVCFGQLKALQMTSHMQPSSLFRPMRCLHHHQRQLQHRQRSVCLRGPAAYQEPPAQLLNVCFPYDTTTMRRICLRVLRSSLIWSSMSTSTVHVAPSHPIGTGRLSDA